MARERVWIDLSGHRELVQKFEALARKHINAAMRRGMRAGMKIVEAAAKAADPPRPGEGNELEGSMKVRAGQRSRRGPSILLHVGGEATQTRHRTPSGHNVNYASLIELGRLTGTQQSQNRRKVAYPFIRPAFYGNQAAIEAELVTALRAELAKHAIKT